MSKLDITKQEALELTWVGGADLASGDTVEVVSTDILAIKRWTSLNRIVVKRLSDGKFFADTYEQGLTEGQEESPWEFDEPNFVEVFPVEKTVTVYEEKEE